MEASVNIVLQSRQLRKRLEYQHTIRCLNLRKRIKALLRSLNAEQFLENPP